MSTHFTVSVKRFGPSSQETKMKAIGSALSVFKNKVEDSHVVSIYRDKQHFHKKSEWQKLKAKRSRMRRKRAERRINRRKKW